MIIPTARFFYTLFLLGFPFWLAAQLPENRQAQIVVKNWAYFHDKGEYRLAIDQTKAAYDLGVQLNDSLIKGIALNREGRSLLALQPEGRKYRRAAKAKFLASNQILNQEDHSLAMIDNLNYLIAISNAEGNTKEKLDYEEKLRELEAQLSAEEENILLEKTVDSLEANQEKLVLKIDELVDSQLKAQLMLAMEKMRVDSLLFLNLQDSIAMDRQRSEIEMQQKELKLQKTQRRLYGAIAAFLLLAAIGVILRFFRIRKQKKLLEHKNHLISTERKRSDQLLLNILPAEVAKELKANGKAAAKRYRGTTVFFSDFHNFTGIVQELGPKELVETLDFYFHLFDEIITEYGLEKIKTIGDAYLCVGGLPKENDFNPRDVVLAALTIQGKLKIINEERRQKDLPVFAARIGVHTGPLVAGVVGSVKFAYDVWGDTVNVASRMETHGEVGQVNISEVTYDRVKDHFVCTYRGEFEMKNRGLMKMYFVKGTLNDGR